MHRTSAKKAKVRQAVVDVIKEAQAGPDTPKAVGALLYAAATKVPAVSSTCLRGAFAHMRHNVLCMLTAHTKAVFGSPCSSPPTHSATARRCCTTSWTAESRCRHCAWICRHVTASRTGCSAAQCLLVWTHPCSRLITRTSASRHSCMQANHQLDGALDFLSALGSEPLDAAAFEEACGVGVEVSQR